MLEIVRDVIASVLNALYQMFGFAVIVAILFMFLYMHVKENNWKITLQRWCEMFKTSADFRRVFFLTFYTAMILFKTLFCRHVWQNPLSNVLGIWGIYNANGELTTEAIENIVLFIPFAIFLLCCFKEKILGRAIKFGKILWKTGRIVFLFSVTIEFLQLFFRIGTFQLSDIFYNTLGGVIGGVIYWIGCKIIHRKKQLRK